MSPATHGLTALGATVQLSAEVGDQNARVMAGATVTWTSSASSMATVDASGLVTAAGAIGTATITASAGPASGSAVVTVTQSVASVEVSPSVDELTALGQTVQLTAEAFDENGHAVAGAEFAWETSDATVATVDASGLVTGVAVGAATITVSAGEASGSAAVTVSVTPPRVQNVNFVRSPKAGPARGYGPGERIEVAVSWDSALEVTGEPPTLTLEIGEDRRAAHMYNWNSRASATYARFRYEVRAGDEDTDGLSIRADALVLPDGSSIVSPDGVEADLDLGEHVIVDDALHKVSAREVPIRQIYWITSPYSYETGYLDEERIEIQIRWRAPIRVHGIPYLELQIGDHTRPAVMVSYTETDTRFRYIVGRDDHDADGVGFTAEAIQLVNGASIVSAETGEPVQIVLDEEDVVENHDSHKVRPHDPFPEPRMCTVELREALKYVGATGSVVAEWDGTPLRVDIADNFPDHVTDADLSELLAPIGIAAEKIEAKLGYPVLEMGGIVPVPRGTPPGWDQDYDRFSASARGSFDRAASAPLLRREKHQLLAFYLNDDAWFWDHVGGPPHVAFVYAGVTAYNKRTSGDWWYNQDDCCIGRWASNGRDGGAIVHEVFHLLGFKHPDEPIQAGVLMAWGSTIAPWLTASPVHYVADKDIEVLGCLFPEGGR